MIEELKNICRICKVKPTRFLLGCQHRDDVCLACNKIVKLEQQGKIQKTKTLKFLKNQ